MQEYISSVRILLKVANGRSLDNAIGAHDSPLSRQIAYGVLRNFYSLSAALEHLLTKPLADKHQDIELLLLAGIYSINSLNRPAHASVNFTVDAAAGLKKPWAKKLINGV
jgi:16S rRNA (cytosine967-C5)-methyltransferase